MYSLNVPIAGEVRELTEQLRSQLLGLDTIRETKTLVLKRLDVTDEHAFSRAQKEVRDALRGTEPFRCRVTGIDHFERPTSGTKPVIFLTVEGHELERIHQRLVATFGAVPGIEGEDYRPHITLGRGGDRQTIERLLETDIDPIAVPVNRLIYWDAHRDLPCGELPLPVR